MPDNYTLSFSELDRSSLSIAGGKAANLGELTRAGFPVPPGFCVATEAYELVAAGADLEPVLSALDTTAPDEAERLEKLAALARERLLDAPAPDALVSAIRQAYEALGEGRPLPVAVRSSATAEDLPTASFAGQQDTYLNVVGSDAVLDAVRRCWASLWTGRAAVYRASNGIPHRVVRLAVVVQQMVEVNVAGVLFTANPLTERRRQAVIDASPGLGEAVVSGAVNPDRFVVNTEADEIVERHIGDKRVQVQALPGGGTQRVELPGSASSFQQACLSDAQVCALAQLGAQIEAHYGAPQDIEWAFDVDGKLWVVQARPITTLFPLPVNAPNTDGDLRVYFSLNVAQGVFRPFTPMGIQGFRLLASSVATLWGRPPRDPAAGPGALVEAAQRLFIDITPPMRSAFGRRLLRFVLERGEARSVSSLDELAADPRLTHQQTSLWQVVRLVVPFLARTHLPLRILRALLFPASMRQAIGREVARVLALGDLPAQASAHDRLQAVERLLYRGGARGPISAFPAIPIGLGAFSIAGRLLGDMATADEKEMVLRGLPDNFTTEMDLQLWALAQRVRNSLAAAQMLRDLPPERLAVDYRSGSLPAPLQGGLAEFLSAYGHRGVAEIDLGLPRWEEDPTHIFGVLSNYLQLQDPALAPDAQFQRAARQAEAMVVELSHRAARKSWLRGVVVRFFFRRARRLLGLREAPKFYAIVMLAKARALLQSVGEELALAGRLEAADDIFFITLPEAYTCLAEADLRALVKERRASYERELHRRHLPRVLLSNGTEPGRSTDARPAGDAVLYGTAASAGVVTARARTILDPRGARLEPGDVLVAPSTDPGWTPLFLTASGLVMEMGGPMSHGAVVAREYGIPAVVGVPGATERIATGQHITVDGSAGTVTILPLQVLLD